VTADDCPTCISLKAAARAVAVTWSSSDGVADARAHSGQVDPNRVRAALSNEHGLTVSPRALSATYSALASQGVIRSLGWIDRNDDVRGGNAGRPARAWEWVAA
jgi:hypothetical protein